MQLVLNCKRFSYFRPFTHDIITQNTTHSNIVYLYRGHSASTLLGKGKGVDKKRHRKKGIQSKKWWSSRKFVYVLFSVTQSLFLLGFSWSYDNVTASNKKSPSKKESISVSKSNYITFAQNYDNSAIFSIKKPIVKHFTRHKQWAALRKLLSLPQPTPTI